MLHTKSSNFTTCFVGEKEVTKAGKLEQQLLLCFFYRLVFLLLASLLEAVVLKAFSASCWIIREWQILKKLYKDALYKKE